jgi:hypothetical protein
LRKWGGTYFLLAVLFRRCGGTYFTPLGAGVDPSGDRKMYLPLTRLLGGGRSVSGESDCGPDNSGESFSSSCRTTGSRRTVDGTRGVTVRLAGAGES